MRFSARKRATGRHTYSTILTPDAVTSLCHDLRQPLAAILLVAEDFAQPDGSLDPRLLLIQREARFMADAVKEVLVQHQVSRDAETDIRAVVNEAVARAQPTTSSELRVELGTERRVALSSVALGRALSCLLDNAIRASSGTPITTIARDRGPRTEIVVIDQGAGLGNVTTVHGLGHRIVRSLIEPAGGSLTLSPGRAGGAVATLTLPNVTSSGRLEHVS